MEGVASVGVVIEGMALGCDQDWFIDEDTFFLFFQDMKFASNCNTTYSQQIGSRIADVRIPLPLPFATPLSHLPLPLLYT